MDIAYKENDELDSLTKFSNLINKHEVDQKFSIKADHSVLMTQLDSLLFSFNQFKKEEKLIIEILMALNIDSFVTDLNIFNHNSFSNLFLFAKNHSIDIEEDSILTFYFSNISIIKEEDSKSSLKLFIQLLQDNIDLIDQDRLIIIFDLFEFQSFENKNELIFIIAELYLIKENIFNDDQTLSLLEQIYIFCFHSQFQLLDVATGIG